MKGTLVRQDCWGIMGGQMEFDRRISLMILSALPGLGPVNIRRLDESIDGGVQQLLQMDTTERRHWCSERVVTELGEWRKHFDPDRVGQALAAIHGDYVTFEEAGYPAGLSPYPDRPIGLYRCHADQAIPTRCLAVVGTRKPSAYGRKLARELTVALCGCGFTIASGLAEGIDTEAHRAALACGGTTTAILGGGLMRCYPASNRDLLEIIKTRGGAWSEFPLWRQADRRSFPQRNRIVAGVSEAVLVVESGATGGSLITARMASEQGKPVYVVPGRIDSPESAGCHALIRDGAQLVTSVEEILEDLNYLPRSLRGVHQIKSTLSQSALKPPPTEGLPIGIWELLGNNGATHVDRIAAHLNIPVAEACRYALSMELDGYLCRRLDGRYERA